MEFFLVFLLGIILAVVILFVLRPGLFSRSTADYSLLEAMFEESMAELEKRQQEYLAVIEQKQAVLLELQHQIVTTLAPTQGQSPKVLAVLELAADDLDVQSIAKRLGLGIGEVQLILEINKNWKALAESD